MWVASSLGSGRYHGAFRLILLDARNMGGTSKEEPASFVQIAHHRFPSRACWENHHEGQPRVADEPGE